MDHGRTDIPGATPYGRRYMEWAAICSNTSGPTHRSEHYPWEEEPKESGFALAVTPGTLLPSGASAGLLLEGRLPNDWGRRGGAGARSPATVLRGTNHDTAAAAGARFSDLRRQGRVTLPMFFIFIPSDGTTGKPVRPLAERLGDYAP